MCKICRGESLEGLTSLYCDNCLKLKSIPEIKGLQILNC